MNWYVRKRYQIYPISYVRIHLHVKQINHWYNQSRHQLQFKIKITNQNRYSAGTKDDNCLKTYILCTAHLWFICNINKDVFFFVERYGKMSLRLFMCIWKASKIDRDKLNYEQCNDWLTVCLDIKIITCLDSFFACILFFCMHFVFSIAYYSVLIEIMYTNCIRSIFILCLFICYLGFTFDPIQTRSMLLFACIFLQLLVMLLKANWFSFHNFIANNTI